MCEHCDKNEVSVERLDTDEQYPCEWISEETGPGACAELAVYTVSDWYVEDHLCDAHRLVTEKEMAEGLGEFLDSVGFRSQFEIRHLAGMRGTRRGVATRVQGNVVRGRRVPKVRIGFQTTRPIATARSSRKYFSTIRIVKFWHG